MIISPDEGGVKTNTRVASNYAVMQLLYLKTKQDCVIDNMKHWRCY